MVADDKTIWTGSEWLTDAEWTERLADAELETAAQMVQRRFARRRVLVLVGVDCDPIPGMFHDEADHPVVIQQALSDLYGHYKPKVALLDQESLQELLRLVYFLGRQDEFEVRVQQRGPGKEWTAHHARVYTILDQLLAGQVPLHDRTKHLDIGVLFECGPDGEMCRRNSLSGETEYCPVHYAEMMTQAADEFMSGLETADPELAQLLREEQRSRVPRSRRSQESRE